MIWSWVWRGEVSSISPDDCRDIAVTHRAVGIVAGKSSVHPVAIDVEDCGAAYRFLMPVLAATPGVWLLMGTERLLQRPILPLAEVLRGIGAEIERVEEGWLIRGKSFARPVETRCSTSLQRGEIGGLSLSIDASQSSQMASALVLAAPLLGLKTLHLTMPDIPSLPYLQMTLALTRDWPVEIPGVTVPDTPIGAVGDWSAALFWFAYACLHPEHEYLLSPLSLESIQGDAVIAQWFNMLGVSVCRDVVHSVSTTPYIEIKAKPLETMPHLVLDVRDNLDTVPVMAALAALLPADITFQNVRNLQYKESDRLHALAEQLMPYAEIELSENELRVIGKGQPLVAGAGFDTKHDHRLAMAFLLFPDAELNDTDCLIKSYPNLLEQLSGE